jgi:transcriptional regulator of NAD metabolism
MGGTLSAEYKEAITHLQMISDIIVSHKIILSTIDIAKTAQQLTLEESCHILYI